MMDEKYLKICSEKTLQTNSKGFFMDFVEIVFESAGNNWIKQEFGKYKTDCERIRSIYSYEKAKKPILDILCNVREVYREKNVQMAENKKLEAEEALKNNNLQKSLILYSQSIIRAPKTDPNKILGLSLLGRAQVLIKLKKYSLALTDIKEALKENLANNFKANAYWKMAVCYKALKQNDKALISFSLAEKLSSIDHETMKELQYDKTRSFEEEEDPTIADVCKYQTSNKIILKEEVGKGRYAVTNDLIKTGETLVIEPPYVACLLPEMFGTHCHYCFARLYAPVPCPNCSNVAFCRPECRDSAITTFHQYECKILDILIGSGMSVLSHTALRMITQNTLDEILEIYKNRQKLKVYSLCTNSDKRSAEDFFQRTLMAAFLLRCLQKSGYFGEKRREKVLPSEVERQIAELILFHLQMLQFNAHEIYETRLCKDQTLKGQKSAYIGVAIYPTVSLFNHDCHPAVTRYFIGKDIVINASRPLRPGDVIAENYGPIFTRRSLQQRQRSLLARYWFECRCQACQLDWPSLNAGLEDVNRRVKCAEKTCMYYFSLPLSKNPLKCPKCKKIVNLMDQIKLLEWCEKQYEEAFQQIDRKDPATLVTILCDAIDAFYRVSCPPHRETQLAQECLQVCLARFGNVSETLVGKTVKQ